MKLRNLLSVLLLVLLTGTSAFGQESLLGKLQDEIRELAARAGPAVVKVSAERELSLPGPLPEAFGGDAREALLKKSLSVGTGFLAFGEGLVLTTHQNVDGVSSVRVTLSDGRMREGTVVGSDPFFKIGIVRIEPVDGVKPLEFSREADPCPGSLAVLVGNTFGASANLSLSILAGSGKRTHPFDPYDNYVVMNSPVLPGDAGGPLLGPGGKVLGMAVGTFSGGAMQVVMTGSGQRVQVRGLSAPNVGIGLAVPASDLKFAVREILKHGRVREGLLGVRFREGTLEVANVRAMTPAAQAGVSPGDVVLSMNEAPLRTDREFGFRLRRVSVGANFRLLVRRGEERVPLTCKL
jgi:S1-C subfamily serine protease